MTPLLRLRTDDLKSDQINWQCLIRTRMNLVGTQTGERMFYSL